MTDLRFRIFESKPRLDWAMEQYVISFLVHGPLTKKVFRRDLTFTMKLLDEAKIDMVQEKKRQVMPELKKIKKAANWGLITGLRLGRQIYGGKNVLSEK